MWKWHKSAPAAQEELWQQRLAPFPGAVVSACFHARTLSLDVYAESAEELLVLQACHGGRVERMEDVDWVAATAPENTPPLIIRDRLVISASDKPKVLAQLRRKYPRRILLSFPAEQAFGTGNHATTSTCLRLLCDEAEKRRGMEWTLADIGCGTGVLALAGLKLGASRAVAFDFDPKAVEVAERNIQRNGGICNLSLYRADVFKWKPTKAEVADVVLANLFSAVLQKAFPKLLRAMKPQGVLIVSGILNTQWPETLQAAQAAGLKLQKKVSRGKWTTALLSRS